MPADADARRTATTYPRLLEWLNGDLAEVLRFDQVLVPPDVRAASSRIVACTQNLTYLVAWKPAAKYRGAVRKASVISTTGP